MRTYGLGAIVALLLTFFGNLALMGILCLILALPIMLLWNSGWRVLPVLIERVKEAAKRENISTNDFVEKTLLLATKDIETETEKEKEKEMRLKRNKEFLSIFAGKWSGQETAEEIMTSIKENDSKDIYTL